MYIYIDSFKNKYNNKYNSNNNNNNNCYIHGKKMFKPKYGVRKLPTSRVPREGRLANNYSAILPFSRPI